MREIKYTTRFQRDYRREKSGRYSKKLDDLLMEVVNLLAADTPLPRRNFDHSLSGEWNDHLDCHIRPDRFSFIANRMTTASNLCALALIVSLGCETAGTFQGYLARRGIAPHLDWHDVILFVPL